MPTVKTSTEKERFNRTQLKAAAHGTLVHRDYAAHFFRWGWVAKQIRLEDNVLDVGCGQDQPLCKVLGGRFGANRGKYVGVDLNPISKPDGHVWAKIIDRFNFIDESHPALTPGKFDVAVNFEVIEHMHVPDGKKMLLKINKLLKPRGRLYLSTPVFNGSAAKNHLHEYRIEELGDLFRDCGFTVERRIGTFASQDEIKPRLSAEELKVMDRLKWWFGGEVLSVLFACNYPDVSRNNLWVCRTQGK